MKYKYAALIHSRTYNHDFISPFAVYPEDFTDDDKDWARENIIAAESSIDMMKGSRWLIIKKDRKCVAGIITYIGDLAEKANSKDGNETLFSDEKKRRTYAFVGISIKKDIVENESIDKKLDEKFLWDVFQNNMADKWNSISVEAKESSYDENIISIEEVDEKELPEEKGKFNGIIFYGTSSYTDKVLFNHYLKEALKRDNKISFCSNLQDFKDVVKNSDGERNKFNILTTSGNNIQRFADLYKKPEEEKQQIKSQIGNRVNNVSSEYLNSDAVIDDKKKQKSILKKIWMWITSKKKFLICCILLLLILWMVIER